jgi:hypothetical protein
MIDFDEKIPEMLEAEVEKIKLKYIYDFCKSTKITPESHPDLLRLLNSTFDLGVSSALEVITTKILSKIVDEDTDDELKNFRSRYQA